MSFLQSFTAGASPSGDLLNMLLSAITGAQPTASPLIGQIGGQIPGMIPPTTQPIFMPPSFGQLGMDRNVGTGLNQRNERRRDRGERFSGIGRRI